MKILVFSQPLVVGGSVLNSIELAASIRDIFGHEVIFFATPGPMVKLVKDKGLRFLAAPEADMHPSLRRIRALRGAVRIVRPDVIHAWEWSQCLDAYYGVYLPIGVQLVVSDMLMHINRVLPKRLPMTFGTPELADRARSERRGPIETIVPPVDVNVNAPDAVNPQFFRERYGLTDQEIILVSVSRLEEWMKAESLTRTIDVVRNLGRTLPLRFVIVGAGPAQSRLEKLAIETNVDLGRPAVVLAGELLDPRPAYAAADIVIGMGGSALRGMAFRKPVIIVGKNGFSATLTPETAEMFYYKGMYGEGDGSPSNRRLASQISALAGHPDQRLKLGEFSRQFVVQRFSLETVCGRLVHFLTTTRSETPRVPGTIADGLRTTAIYFRERVFMWRSVHPGQNREWQGTEP